MWRARDYPVMLPKEIPQSLMLTRMTTANPVSMPLMIDATHHKGQALFTCKEVRKPVLLTFMQRTHQMGWFKSTGSGTQADHRIG